MRPVVETSITQHTLWQALTGQTPPHALRATPIGRAVLDSRDVQEGDLFIAFPGQATDGHSYIDQVFQRGAQAVICEARGIAAAQQAGATLIDCTYAELRAKDQSLGQHRPQIAYVTTNSLHALQRLGAFQRLQRTAADLRVIAVTGSVGKTSTKELASAILRRQFCTYASPGNLNSEQGLPLSLLGLNQGHQRAVLEMGMYDLGEIDTLCRLGRPHVGVITNVGPSHLERLGTLERIAQAKAELVRALPDKEDGGVAILNWDDERVRAMAPLTNARVFRYGLTPEADLWAEDIESAGHSGIRFRFCYRQEGMDSIEQLHVRVPLLGRHSVHNALRAAAVGLVEGMTWEDIVTGLQESPNQLRLVLVPGVNGCTLIDDTYNASPQSSIAALNLLVDLQSPQQGRRVAILGDMRELGSYTTEGHQLVGRRVAEVSQLLITVGELGAIFGHAALEAGMPPEQIHILANDQEAVALMTELAQATDLVLIKGSRAVGMDAIVAHLSRQKHVPHQKPTHTVREDSI